MKTTKKDNFILRLLLWNAFACKQYCYEEKYVHFLFQLFWFPWNGLVFSIALDGTDTKTNKCSFTRFSLLRCTKSGTLFTYSLFIAYGYSFFFLGSFQFYFFSIFFSTQMSFCLHFLFASISSQDKLDSIAAFFLFHFLLEILVIFQFVFVTALKSIILSIPTRLSKMALSFRSWINLVDT